MDEQMLRRVLLSLLVLAGHAGCGTGADSDADVVRAAKAELARLDVAHEGRTVTVEPRADDAMVVFHLPAGMRGGNFEVLVDRQSLKVEDVKIWR